jgi:hypothetical protein
MYFCSQTKTGMAEVGHVTMNKRMRTTPGNTCCCISAGTSLLSNWTVTPIAAATFQQLRRRPLPAWG